MTARWVRSGPKRGVGAGNEQKTRRQIDRQIISIGYLTVWTVWKKVANCGQYSCFTIMGHAVTGDAQTAQYLLRSTPSRTIMMMRGFKLASHA